jgi:hypothetical protein
MGVKGLTTFLKENRSISRSLNLETTGSTRDSIPIVIDAWGYVPLLAVHSQELTWQIDIPFISWFVTLDIGWGVSCFLQACTEAVECLEGSGAGYVVRL